MRELGMAGLSLLAALVLATSASAECAWVLWTMPTTADRMKLGMMWADWGVGGAYETKAECEKQAPPGFDHMCLPGGTDPRGPKGK